MADAIRCVPPSCRRLVIAVGGLASAMRLRRLETFGFKSFADRMTFDFDDGITAVIGPNGCGKSNIVDAIKWVIGEQSAKALRGESMTDVIFNGCASRRAMAFCEVTLVMDQIADRLGADAGDEVALTRRLFRDGTSSYYLNGKACRLKDIKELFMDTGVGTAAYSVIEQGRVGFILDSNTRDRRMILEEAAGISRYKARRKIALRKLERVDLDLQRISEVHGEVKRRAKAVAKQAAAALRYQELTAQTRELRMAFALEDFGRLSGELKSHRERGAELATASAGVAAQLGTLEAALTDADVRLIGLETALRTQEQTRADAQSRRDVAAQRASDANARLTETEEQEQDDRTALSVLAAQLIALREEHALAETAAANIADDGKGGGPSAEMIAARAALDQALTEVDAALKHSDDLKRRQGECLRDLARIDAEHGRLGAARTATAERRGRLETRSGGQTDQLLGAISAESLAKAQVDAAIGAASLAHIDLDGLIRARESAQADAQRLEQELSEIRQHEARTETSLRLLSEQEQRAEGVSRGVRDVLQAMDRFPGIVGMVADLCKVPDEDVVAIETALGAQAQNLITTTQAAAKDAIEFLKRERRGRATFLPLDDIRGDERVDQQLLREAGVVGIASRLIEFKDEHRAAFEFLLGNVLVVETLDHGIAIRRRHRMRCRIVTREGEVINAGGAMTGGRNQGQDGGGLVSRKSEIHRAQEQQAELSVRRQAALAARDAARARDAELTAKVDEQRRAIQAADRTAGDARTALMKAERDRLHLQEATSGFGEELSEIAAEMTRIDDDERSLQGQRELAAASERALGEELARVLARLDTACVERDRLQETVNALRVDLATSAERRVAAHQHLAQLARSVQSREDDVAARERRLAGLDAKRAELTALRDDNAALRATAAAEVALLAEALDAQIKERDALRNGFETQRQEARALNQKQRQVEAERAQVELKANEAQVRCENLSARVLEDFQIDLAEAFLNYVRPEHLDWDTLRVQLNDAEQELAAIGPVNLSAIDELNEVQAREQFLDQQLNDLTRASAKLNEIITQINGISRTLFEATYKEVRKHFQELFRKLFGGGRADLELEKVDELGQPVDLLEAGLEIVAQPPGKNPKIITQLSGGEKALTAIALLFAVYQTKPSPFCILDEVDAPLDEANVDVYNSMIREFVRGAAGTDGPRGGSQFIVITHKKRTMQRADAIYGITQNEPGVSTKISVKIDDVEHLSNEMAPTVRGAGPYSG